MLYVVIGGSGSGKSEFAENFAVKKYNESFSGKLYYAAAMIPYDDECCKRIEKHRAMRSKKGFETIECYTDIGGLRLCENDVVLIECMSNLLANEMYSEKGRKCENIESVILNDVESVVKKAGCAVVVTNEVFSDNISYDSESVKYISKLGYINRKMAEMAEGVTEVVCGIAVECKN